MRTEPPQVNRERIVFDRVSVEFPTERGPLRVVDEVSLTIHDNGIGMSRDEVIAFRDRLELPIPDAALADDLPPFFRFPEGSEEYEYLSERRRELGGPVPRRRVAAPRSSTAWARRGRRSPRSVSTKLRSTTRWCRSRR